MSKESTRAAFARATGHLLLNLSPEEMDEFCQCGSINHRATDGCIPREQRSKSKTQTSTPAPPLPDESGSKVWVLIMKVLGGILVSAFGIGLLFLIGVTWISPLVNVIIGSSPFFAVLVRLILIIIVIGILGGGTTYDKK